MAAALAKYRINPGNVGAKRHDEHFATIVRVAIDNDKPVRIGVNWGSLDQAILTELMDVNAQLRRAARRPRRDDRGDARVGDALGRAGRGDRAPPRPDHPVGQGLGRARPGRRLPAARRALRLPAPPRADRGGDGRQGHHRLDGRPRDPAQRGDRRHDPRLADARARARRASARSRSPSRSSSRWACARSCRRSRACPGCGRTTSHVLPGDGPADPGLPQGADAGVARDAPGRRGAARRGHGLRRQRPGRVEARRHRDQPAGHVRGAGRAGVHRRPARSDAARRRPGRRVHRDPRGLRRAALPDAGWQARSCLERDRPRDTGVPRASPSQADGIRGSGCRP